MKTPTGQSPHMHALCSLCWHERNKGARHAQPERASPREWEVCCGCGRLTTSGIFAEGEPALVACQGRTGRHRPGVAHA